MTVSISKATVRISSNKPFHRHLQPESKRASLLGEQSAITKIRFSSNYFALYKAADGTDIALLVIGIIAAIGSGVPLPLIGILFGQLIDGFNSAGCGGSGRPTNTSLFLSSVDDKVEKIAIIAAVNFFLIWTYTTCWSNLGERLVRKMRQRYLRAVLRQDMAFFDTLTPGEVGTRLSADLLTIQNGTSEKMGILISSVSYFVTSYIVAFIKLPKLAGQLVSLLPAFAIVSILDPDLWQRRRRILRRISPAPASHLDLARKQGTLKALAAACVMGSLFFVGYSANALAFFSGSNLIASSGNPSTVGSVYTVIFLLLDASFIVGQIAPYLQTFSAASGAGQSLRATIDKISPIDGTDTKIGITPPPGDVNEIAVELQNVEFSYPARPDEKALQGLSISVPAGHRVALVGLSGSGKSTVASLLQRFYDPTSGRVLLNGTDLRDYNVRWLRSQIGLVGQEPVLFDCSILQSIAHGLEKTGTDLHQILTTQTHWINWKRSNVSVSALPNSPVPMDSSRSSPRDTTPKLAKPDDDDDEMHDEQVTVETENNQRSHRMDDAVEGDEYEEAIEAQLSSPALKYPPRVILKRIIWLLRREWPYILLGLFTSAIMGGSYSGEAVLFGHVIEALNPQCHSPDGVRSAGREFGLYFFILALIQFFAYSINGLVWGLVAERLLFRLRRVSFNTMMDQRLTWYEAQGQNPASMIASLSNDANNLGGVTGTVIGTIFCILINLIAGISVSLAIAWRIAIVILALVPIILAAGYLRLKVLADFQKRHETAYIKSNSLAIEAVQCIKTVISLGREEDVMQYRRGKASGQLLAFAPDFSKAHVSAVNFFKLMDQRPAAVERRKRVEQEKKERRGKSMFSSRAKASDNSFEKNNEDDVETRAASDQGADAVEKTQPSTIIFDNVSFTYPTRSDPALKNVSLTIPPGSFAAFVGQSGSGKTTAMSLIENFYTPSSGSVTVDGLRTDRTPDAILRRDIAIVPQEPVIFYGTHRNLSTAEAEEAEEEEALLAPYKEDTTWQTSIPESIIIEACKAAGIHETIISFKHGYDTLISSSQLSGGQKQRLSIARALIRKPRLLLLDESTSALDSQSEQAFQQTLTHIREKGQCTILAIAHRMRTIKDADLIFLFENGQLDAKGGYAQLIRTSEKFKAMVSYQSLN
ncbi:related to multidrug resistance protein 4 [Ustilago trichophora]|uniref:Related to multidrug resistance protein 4 n=1 Tax=Ustilago trichophora TaxID=86804 RepID=A0A5C3E6T1_9BASI|nr:related to multidrug resistance protein 4 [Ustilago trichophora]